VKFLILVVLQLEVIMKIIYVSFGISKDGLTALYVCIFYILDALVLQKLL
jgi:hypothetical protein